jgi:hypothetical protein
VIQSRSPMYHVGMWHALGRRQRAHNPKTHCMSLLERVLGSVPDQTHSPPNVMGGDGECVHVVGARNIENK